MIRSLYASFALISLVSVLFHSTSHAQTQERLLYNVNGYGFAGDTLKQFSLLHIGADGRVKNRGTDEDLRSMQLPASLKRVDMKGAHILPGLIDAHGHVLNLGFKQLQLDLTGVTSLSEAVSKISAYANANPNLPWIKGRGWNQELWPVKEFPKAKDIDQVVADRPVWLTRIDGHAAWANQKAMQLAGISRATQSPDGGEIIRDQQGNPIGIFIDQAESLVERVIPPASKQEKQQALKAALKTMAQLGLTGLAGRLQSWSPT